MKKFIINILFFALFFTALSAPVAGIIYALNSNIKNGNYYSIGSDLSYIILGDSHPESAFNDSLIDGFKNIAQGGEAYFYTYYKIKKIINSNSNIKTVFIDISTSQLSTAVNEWIWGDDQILRQYPKYSPIIDYNGFILLLSHNSSAVLKSQSVSLKNNIKFIREKGNKNFIEEMDWGGYVSLIRDKTDSLINAIPLNNIVDKFVVSSVNLEYLIKTITFCKKNGVKVFLIRSPLHARYSGLAHEKQFNAILRDKFAAIEFLDFRDYPLQNSEFGDLEHLNYLGAKRFSIFFNKLIKAGLLENERKQEVIGQAIDLLR